MTTNDVVPVVEPATPTTHETENHSQQWVCRECGCTEDRACRDGCWWYDLDPDGTRGGPLCSRCARMGFK